ncbi:hypothetical protein HOP50_15g75420 [Chloropicon primus]|uniref:Uncharacterized protein n=1 Tax=Chloropicon primus TaxID=1764295 RepID=A0A5B8MWT2_9CHLO|nr:hypothetical protein A3770_15p75180 [Chloropicon primus]QDZ25003.1 hypothetical protein A3770_15p75210 [Chloropicon primus]UPR04208.1 hypothetical protein HOP50_15g75420 [Chloropicon primus]|eukprot:QDZ25000.1 hypothetical protein A3770_15p75180 [Chloropicon primus]
MVSCQSAGHVSSSWEFSRAQNSNLQDIWWANNRAEELEKAFNRTGALQKDYTNKLEQQLEELKGILGSKQAQVTYLEDKVGNLKENYGEKLSQAQAKIAALEQEQRRYKHSHTQERARLSENLQRDLSALNVQVRQLNQSKTELEKQVERLSIENSVLKRKEKVSPASVFEFDVNRVSKLEKEMQECKQQLGLEKARNAKLQKKIQKLEEESRKADLVMSEKYRNFADMKVPYKEQLRRENEELRSSLLASTLATDPAAKQKELDDIHLNWVNRVLNSGHFEGSVCGNSWWSSY